MSSTLKKVCDFIIKIVIIFSTVLVLLFFAEKYPMYSLVFGAIALVYVLAIIVGGLLDIFTQEEQ